MGTPQTHRPRTHRSLARCRPGACPRTRCLPARHPPVPPRQAPTPRIRRLPGTRCPPARCPQVMHTVLGPVRHLPVRVRGSCKADKASLRGAFQTSASAWEENRSGTCARTYPSARSLLQRIASSHLGASGPSLAVARGCASGNEAFTGSTTRMEDLARGRKRCPSSAPGKSACRQSPWMASGRTGAHGALAWRCSSSATGRCRSSPTPSASRSRAQSGRSRRAASHYRWTASSASGVSGPLAASLAGAAGTIERGGRSRSRRRVESLAKER
mmetsp:Transcript_45438/g.144999  ORF Transcript_45438/g.144999 Transcript_45438/m.144999 type:complete len:272 (+) Transcript_45438:616-1431(+)